MTIIAHQELTSSQASITFSSIPQTGYTDLYLVVSARTTRNTGGWSDLRLTINGTSSTYTYRALQGSGAGVNSYIQSDITATGFTWGGAGQANNTASTFGNSAAYFPNYTSSVAKSVSFDGVSETNATNATQKITAGLWSGTSAITSLELYTYPEGFDFVSGSSATLYGVNKYATSGTPKATGGAISYVDGYWVHTFTASGTFTPTENLSNVEYLVVAGGGGGGRVTTDAAPGGGGGAGGYRCSVTGESSGGGASAESKLSLTASTNYTVTVGAGGSAGGRNSGSTSSFDSISATGGGYGGGYDGSYYAPATGGSGGAGNGTSGDVNGRLGASGTANQGFAGGDGSGGNGAGGGGGAGGDGADAAATDIAGVGGIGVSSSITGSAIVRGGGGGGGGDRAVGALGGSSVGGQGGGTNGTGTAGAVNTGSGGGGGGNNNGTGVSGGNGGSGIVIVRYAA